jgi:hypothetical protein
VLVVESFRRVAHLQTVVRSDCSAEPSENHSKSSMLHTQMNFLAARSWQLLASTMARLTAEEWKQVGKRPAEGRLFRSVSSFALATNF